MPNNATETSLYSNFAQHPSANRPAPTKSRRLGKALGKVTLKLPPYDNHSLLL